MTSTSSTYFCNDTFPRFISGWMVFWHARHLTPLLRTRGGCWYLSRKGEVQSIHNVNDTTPLTDVATLDSSNFNKEEETESWKKDGNKSYKYDITSKGIFYVNHLLYCIVKLAKKGIRQLLVVLSLDYGNLRFKSVI